MITLLTFPAGLNSFALSPFCVKARHMLTLAGAAWQREDLDDPRKMPYGKLPAIRLESGEVIADTNLIRAYLEQQGADFMPGLSARERALSHAIIRMADEHMYFLGMLDRWGRDDVWPVVRRVYFKGMPPVVRRVLPGMLRRGLRRGMKVQGLGRLSEADLMIRAEEDLAAAAGMLHPDGFLFGAAPTLADISLASMLEAWVKTPVETPLVRRVKGDAVLMEYIDRFNAALA
ncbi:glutathione S-transferase family protein [Alphaproteobacteria bacterium KMM 3653]|uniref:Glutathione S-transferase family protein n=1 Tax=Harenicola maris TaxID=2841044 RepID=A0AAP2CQR1_9RHOB|nr:glutathione S-transferase family protein [Harenicola maris]